VGTRSGRRIGAGAVLFCRRTVDLCRVGSCLCHCR